MLWSGLGFVVACGLALVAWRNSGRAAGFYDGEVYGMTARTHRRFAAISLAFAIFFAAALASSARAVGLGGFAVYVLAAILYGTSFLRGAESEG